MEARRCTTNHGERCGGPVSITAAYCKSPASCCGMNMSIHKRPFAEHSKADGVNTHLSRHRALGGRCESETYARREQPFNSTFTRWHVLPIVQPPPFPLLFGRPSLKKATQRVRSLHGSLGVDWACIDPASSRFMYRVCGQKNTRLATQHNPRQTAPT